MGDLVYVEIRIDDLGRRVQPSNMIRVDIGGVLSRTLRIMTVVKGTSVPPVDVTLTRVVVLMRLLGWTWLVALVVTTLIRQPQANRLLLWAALVVGTAGVGITLLAAKKGFLGSIWYVILDGVVATFLLLVGWLSEAGDFVAGGYPMSWLFVVAYASNMRWTVTAAVLATGLFAVLHAVMGLSAVRLVGSLQFLVIAIVSGWAFDSLRHREGLRIEAEELLMVERENAARLKERTEMARTLHDSVLQTLKLVKGSATDPTEVRYLARVQERDLKRTINEYRSPHEDSFRARLLDARAEVEDRHRVEIEAAVRHDAEMSPSLQALIEAATEAMTNAAKHSGSTTIDLYAEIRSDGIEVNVRDRGNGFDPDTAPPGGMVDSIVERMAEVGGTADITSALGAGTEVSLFLPAGS